MRSLFAAAALALVLAPAAASARPHHHHRHHHRPAALAYDDPRCASAARYDAMREGAGCQPRFGARTAGRPQACAGIAWCGCWLRLHLGISDPRLNLNRAIEWAHVGTPASGPAAGVIAVWRHHVGIITENLGGGMIRLLSGNDGGAVRDRVRSTRGIVAYRQP